MSSADDFFYEVLEAVNPKKEPAVEEAFFRVVKRWGGSAVYFPKTKYEYEERQKAIRGEYKKMIEKMSKEYGLCPVEVVKIIKGRPRKAS